MDILKAVNTRKSIRGFKPDPVSKDTVKTILSIACRAPSGSNIQPWEFTVVTGEVLENIKRDNAERYRSGAPPASERPSAGKPPGSVYRARQVELGSQLYRLMGIARGDYEGRLHWRERGVRFFDAPAAVIISVDTSLSEAGSLMDIGMVTQTICLVALHYGLGTCIEGQGIAYPDIIRKHLNIPESKRIIISLAIGYPDWGFPANRLESTRADIDDITTWCGFD
jgi:nitroreductase